MPTNRAELMAHMERCYQVLAARPDNTARNDALYLLEYLELELAALDRPRYQGTWKGISPE